MTVSLTDHHYNFGAIYPDTTQMPAPAPPPHPPPRSLAKIYAQVKGSQIYYDILIEN